jgi:orotate phosphoribosyltransferase
LLVKHIKCIIIVTQIGFKLVVNTEAAKRLKEIAIEEGAYLRSDTPTFRLASGMMSKFYFDGRKISLSSKGAYHVARMILDEISDIKVAAIGGPVLGAALMVPAVIALAHAEGKELHAFVVRQETKEHGTKQKIEGYLKKGWKVVIVDDVITTGGSVLKSMEAVEEAGCKILKVIVLVDRYEGGSDELIKRGYKFQAFLDLKPSGEMAVSQPASASR